MLDRREFLKITAALGAATLSPGSMVGRSLRSTAFAVHPFIEDHPDAVFIARTSVDVKTNSAAKYGAGYDFGKSVIVPVTSGGFPLTHAIGIKPNLTCRDRGHPMYTIERSMGIVTDAFFVEGIIESMKELGMEGSQFHMREVSCHSDFADGGYIDMAARTGADIGGNSSNAVWVDIPDGTWFRKIGYFWPVNAPDSFLLNIAKFKAHTMGLTLSAKNLQGSIIGGYHNHCLIYGRTMAIPKEHVNPYANQIILHNYNRHVANGIPRWDRPGDYGGIRQEIWASRCLDNNSVTKPGLHIIEGIYGRDGHFIDGPSPEGLATDYMTNIIIFGKNPFHCDIVGHWLGGHEPGNFGLFHMARERGLSKTINPAEITVYEWTFDGSAVVKPLSEFERTPLKTLYLRRDYDGQTEDYWHLVDEPFNYGTVSVPPPESRVPEAFIVHQNYPNPFNAQTTIQYTIPRDGRVCLEIYDITGQRIDVLVDGFRPRGSHLAVWNSRHSGSGVYLYRVLFDGFSSTKAMTLLK
jgi:uncharacterized protein (DUF362 family)